MSGEYSVVPYSIDHRQAVVDLHKQLMPRRRGENERYFSWKYEENPYLPTPNMALVFSRSQLVAMRGLCGTRWVIPSRGPTTIPAAEDLIIDRRHRNRGLFLIIDKELRRLAADLGHPSIISLSGNPTTQRLQAIGGWKQIRTLDRAYREATQSRYPLRKGPTVRKVVSRTWRVARRVGVGFRQRPSDAVADGVLDGVVGASASVEVRSEPDIPSMVALSATPMNACFQERTEEFYRWRLQNPDRRYRFVYWRDPGCRGFVVLALTPHNHQRVKIVDSGAASIEIMVELLGALIKAQRPTYELLPAALPDEVLGVLEQMGFSADAEHVLGRPAAFFERATSKNLPSIAAGNPLWDVDMIDTMLA